MKEKNKEIWDAICRDVEKEVERVYRDIPLAKRRQLGVEPEKDGNFRDADAYDRNRMLVCYISLLQWQKRAYSLFAMERVFDD